MKHYEVSFILKPALIEEEVSAKLEFVKGVLSKNDVGIQTVVSTGTRKLAHKIKKYEGRTYFVIYFKVPTSLIAELGRVLRITEEVIRFLIVRYENKKEISVWEKLSQDIKQSKKETKPMEAPGIQ